MTLKKLQDELILSKKEHNKLRNNVLTTLIAQIKSSAIDQGCRDNIDENFVNMELLRAKKVAEEMIDTCPTDRFELLAQYVKQLDIINEFAPVLISDEEEIKKLVYDIVNNEYDFVKSNKGQIMRIVMPVLKGNVDMKVANKVISNMIQ